MWETNTVEAPVRVVDHGITWTLQPSFAERFGRLDLDWRRLSADPRVTVVKEGPARAVYVLDPGEGHPSIFIKEYRRPTWFDMTRFMFRRSAARAEGDMSWRLAALGVPVPRVLAFAEQRRCRRVVWNFLVTEAVDGGTPLNTVVRKLPRDEVAELARLYAPDLGRFIRRLHDSGVLHHDLHAGNILMERRDSDVTFTLTDLHDIEVRQRRNGLEPRERFDNLVLFNRFWDGTVNRSARRRFLAGYEGDQLIGLDPKALEQRSLADKKAFWSRRNRRCTRTNKYFVKGRVGALRFFLRRGFDLDAVLSLALNPPPGQVIKDGRTTSVTVHELCGPRGVGGVVVKRYKRKGFDWALRYLLRPSRGVRAWKLGNAMVVRHLPTAAPIACWEVRRWGVLVESGLLTERIDPADHLQDLLTHILPNLDVPGRLKVGKDAAELLGRTLRLLHERGFSHRDLKATNILIERSGNYVSAVRIIDLDGLTLVGCVPTERRIKDIARLARSVSDTGEFHAADAWRMLSSYLGLAAHRRGAMHRWWTAISGAVEARKDE